jgi:hypothetical protein
VKCKSCERIFYPKKGRYDNICRGCDNKRRLIAKRNKKCTHKPYYECGPTTKSLRRHVCHSFCTSEGCPVEELSPTLPAKNLIHLSKNIRDKMRTVDGIKMPSEKIIIRLKKELSLSHGTATASSSLSLSLSPPPLSPSLSLILLTQLNS